MKRYLKIFISVITIFTVFLLSIFTSYEKTYAMDPSDIDFWYGVIAAEDPTPGQLMFRQAFEKSVTQDAGFIVGDLERWQLENTRKVVAKWLNKRFAQNKTEDQVTNEDIVNYYNDYRQNITINNNNELVYNDNSKQDVDCMIETYKESLDYYPVYGCSFQASTEYFGSNILQISKLLDGSNFIQIGTYYVSYPNGAVYVYEYDSNDQLVVIKSSDYNDDFKYGIVYRILDNGVVKTVEPFYPESNECKVYQATSSSTIVDVTQSFDDFPMIDLYGHSYFQAYFNRKPNQSCIGNDWNRAPKTFSTAGNSLLMFNSVQGVHNYLDTVGMGKNSYYVNTSVNNSWNNSTGDYAINSNNKNTVTYGDVNNYIDDHHSETNNYPTFPDIEHWIDTQNDPIPTPTPGPGGESSGSGTGGSGGSATATANNQGVNVTIHNDHTINFPGWFGSDTVSGNTVSGNGVNGSGGGLNFGFLGTLGQTLKSLIENIGTAIVDIITGISSVIAEVVTNIPTVFGDFVGAVLGWLPPELQALISMAVVAMITYGLIKLIRG